jgi:hypothetical protein
VGLFSTVYFSMVSHAVYRHIYTPIIWSLCEAFYFDNTKTNAGMHSARVAHLGGKAG